jgi:hypothetical protein
MASKRTAGLGTTFHSPGRGGGCDRESIDRAQRALYIEAVGHEPRAPTVPPGMTEAEVLDQWEWPRAKRRKHSPLTLEHVARVRVGAGR